MLRKNEKGATFISLVIVLSIIGVITLSVLTVFPVYMENLAVKKSVEAIENDPQLKSMSPGKMRSLFEKKLDMNQVTSVRAKDAKIGRGITDISFKVEYEVRKEYIGNIDVVMSFSDGFTVDL